jgi:2-dehydro-3-deoxygluconokinase
VNRLGALARWVMPGLEEGRILTGGTTPEDVAGFYLERGAEGVVVKLGRDGAYVRTGEIDAFVPAAPVAQVVDTVGAGDGFAAGFISALLEERDALFAARRGNLMGGMAIQAVGDSEGLPNRERLDAAEKAARDAAGP